VIEKLLSRRERGTAAEGGGGEGTPQAISPVASPPPPASLVPLRGRI